MFLTSLRWTSLTVPLKVSAFKRGAKKKQVALTVEQCDVIIKQISDIMSKSEIKWGDFSKLSREDKKLKVGEKNYIMLLKLNDIVHG